MRVGHTAEDLAVAFVPVRFIVQAVQIVLLGRASVSVGMTVALLNSVSETIARATSSGGSMSAWGTTSASPSVIGVAT